MTKFLSPERARDTRDVVSHYQKALAWVKQHTVPEQGVMVSDRQQFPYPEVTGYLIPTLIRAGEMDWVYRYGRFLLYMQRPSGAFAGPDGREYAFDTGQALRGLLALSNYDEEFKSSAVKAADYLISCIDENGRVASIYDAATPEHVHVYTLPALHAAAEALQRPDYLSHVERAVAYYKRQPDVLNEKYLTHFLAYILEGFIELGEAEWARPAAVNVFARQKKNGQISAYPHVPWVCAPGLAQLAVVAYRYGWNEKGDRAVGYLCDVQGSAGGFRGSYGAGARYFPDEQVSWTNKYFLDAVHGMITRCWAPIRPTAMEAEDGRCDDIVGALGALHGQKLLAIGGQVALTEAIRERFSDIEIREGNLSRAGTLLNLPYEDETFDAAYSIGVLGQVVELDKAVQELCRVVREEGRIVVILKGQRGLMDETSQTLKRFCRDVREQDLAVPEGSGVCRMWTAVKGPALLDSGQWHNAIVGDKTVKALARRIRQNHYPSWIRPLLEQTSPGDHVLELGSGTGELAAILALYDRKVTLLDYSEPSLAFARALFEELKVKGNFVHGDILQALQMEDQSVDWVFSSGVLEHYTTDTLHKIMRESARVARKGVMSLVPNSRSLFYRMGKMRMEQEGQWPYGRETPQGTMVPHFEQAGLNHIREYAVSPYHALAFSKDLPAAKAFYDHIDYHDLESLGQGYLLFTCGVKHA